MVGAFSLALLVAGLLAAPVGRWIDRHGGQRACWVLAAIKLLPCLPVHLLLPGSSAAPPALRRSPAEAASAPPGWRELLARPGFAWLCAAFTANTLVFSALSVHLLNLLVERGTTPQQAAWIGAAVGPMQVLGRALEFAFLRHIRPSRLGALTLWLLPASLLALTLVQPGALVWAGLFALLYGSGNGMMTIVHGALPAELFGREHYGAINGALSSPVLLFGMAVRAHERAGATPSATAATAR